MVKKVMSSCRLLLVFLSIVLWESCLGAKHIVDWSPHAAQMSVLGHEFHPGDIMQFKYKIGYRLYQVNHVGYFYCNHRKGVLLGTKGNTSFQLKTTGFYFFISQPYECTVYDLKLVIFVHPTNYTGN